jgi:hypothetical protein
MRTAGQCLAKAAEMERVADSCPIAAIAADYEMLAVYWRILARRAARQDGFPHIAANSN